MNCKFCDRKEIIRKLSYPLLFKFIQKNRILLRRDIITNFNDFIQKRNSFLFVNNSFFYSKENNAGCPDSPNIKNISNLHSKSIIHNNGFLPFFCKVNNRIFTRSKPKIRIILGSHNFNPSFLYGIFYNEIARFIINKDFLLNRRRYHNIVKELMKNLKLIYFAQEYDRAGIRNQVYSPKISRSFSKSSSEYPVQSILCLSIRSNISHNEMPQFSAALPIEILCSLKSSNVFCIFQDFIAFNKSLLTDSLLSICQFSSIFDSSPNISLFNLTEIVFVIQNNILYTYIKLSLLIRTGNINLDDSPTINKKEMKNEL